MKTDKLPVEISNAIDQVEGCLELCEPEDLAAFSLVKDHLLMPIDMILHCPACGMQHIDKADEEPPMIYALGYCTSRSKPEWTNPPHRSHLCAGCDIIWRPADVATNGVAAIKTEGKADTPVDSYRKDVKP